MKSAYFVKVPKNIGFSKHFQFYRVNVQNACKISIEEVIRFYNELIRKTIHFNNTRMLMSAFFKGIFQQTFKVQKSVILTS